jgi:hypothetical protein
LVNRSANADLKAMSMLLGLIRGLPAPGPADASEITPVSATDQQILDELRARLTGQDAGAAAGVAASEHEKSHEDA